MWKFNKSINWHEFKIKSQNEILEQEITLFFVLFAIPSDKFYCKNGEYKKCWEFLLKFRLPGWTEMALKNNVENQSIDQDSYWVLDG